MSKSTMTHHEEEVFLSLGDNTKDNSVNDTESNLFDKKNKTGNGHVSESKPRRQPAPALYYLTILGLFYTPMIEGFLFVGMNIIYVEMIEMYSLSRAEASTIQTVYAICTTFPSVVVGQIVAKTGVPGGVIIGGLLGCTGALLSSFANSYTLTVIAYSVFAGIGQCFSRVSFLFAPGQIAEKKKKHLLTIAVLIGSGIGRTISSLVMEYLVDHFLFRGAMIIIGGICLQSCTFGVCLWSTMKARQKDGEKGKKRKTGFLRQVSELMKNATFVLMLITTILSYLILIGTIFFMVDDAETVGFSRETGAVFASVYGLGSLGGKFVNGFIHQNKRWPGTVQYGCILLMFGICLAILPLLTTYTSRMILFAVLGILSGPAMDYAFLVLYEIIPSELYPVGTTVIVASLGISGLLIGRIGGWIRDSTGSYSVLFHSGVVVCGVPAILLFGLEKIKKCLKRDPPNVNQLPE